MEATKLQTRLKVVLLSLPPRTQAVLDFFFSSTGRSSFAPSGEEAAEVAIFDFDTLESRQHWDAWHARRGGPGIALSTQSQDVASAIWVQKPVTPAALLAAAAELRTRRWNSAPAAVEPAPAPAPVAAAPVAATATPPVPASVVAEPSMWTESPAPAPALDSVRSRPRWPGQWPRVRCPRRHRHRPPVADWGG